MIYVSTACVNEKKLNENLKIFNKLNIKNIELTGNISIGSKSLKILTM